MNIDLLSKMIRELLMEHDEVGLPGFGAFVAELVPASFSERGYVINPPYRRVVFLPGKGEDGKLVNLYSRISGLDANKVRGVLERLLADVRSELLEKKIVVFPGLGRLRATRQNNFFFICDEDLDIYPDGFALESVSLKSHPVPPAAAQAQEQSLASIVSSLPEPTVEPVTAPAENPLPEPTVEPARTESTVEPAPATEPLATPDTDPHPEPPVLEPDPLVAEPAGLDPLPALSEEIVEPVLDVPVPRKRHFRWWLLFVILLVFTALFFAVFLVLASAAPDFIDSILYTPEELRILNW